jgi:hypothetical protein
MHNNKENKLVLQTQVETFKSSSISLPLEAGLSPTPIFFTLNPYKPETLMASNCGHRVEIMGPTQA